MALILPQRAWRVAAFALLVAAGCSLVIRTSDLVPREDTVDADASGGDAGDAGQGCTAAAACCNPPSGPGLSDCGPDGGESCCASLLVNGGVFVRSSEANSVATVSSFRLDRFEVTVGRFRPFVNAVVEGWVPQPGSGKHSHLNDGAGLAATANDAGLAYEPGWDGTWPLPKTLSAWNAALSCSTDNYRTWTLDVGVNEALPINCETWFEAYAFCIWDGGFLPSETEWGYAATGGSEQRAYPWPDSPTPTLDCSYANWGGSQWPSTACIDAGANKVGSESPKGDGRYGQADLAGNIYEWTADWYDPQYRNPCSDCANFMPASNRVMRGGSFEHASNFLLASTRYSEPPASRRAHDGFRCARAP